jgi:hypothetical protein
MQTDAAHHPNSIGGRSLPGSVALASVPHPSSGNCRLVHPFIKRRPRGSTQMRDNPVSEWRRVAARLTKIKLRNEVIQPAIAACRSLGSCPRTRLIRSSC